MTFADGSIPDRFRLPGGVVTFEGVGPKSYESRAIRGALSSWHKLVRG